MIDAFSGALTTALTAFVTDVTGAIGDNLAIVLPVSIGVAGIGLVYGVVRGFLKRR